MLRDRLRPSPDQRRGHKAFPYALSDLFPSKRNGDLVESMNPLDICDTLTLLKKSRPPHCFFFARGGGGRVGVASATPGTTPTRGFMARSSSREVRI